MQTIPAKTIVTHNKSTSWFGCEYNMNLYRGCTHGCIYCDSRSDCYQNPQFDTVMAKENALELVRNELARKVKKGVIATGAMSDPYNPFEKELELSRKALLLLDAYEFGVAIATKSDLLVRDADILQDISVHSPVLCKITITTLDEELAAKVEPRAPAPARRMAAVRALSAKNIFCGVLLMPVLPFLQDNKENILRIVEETAEAGGRFIHPYFGVTLRAGMACSMKCETLSTPTAMPRHGASFPFSTASLNPKLARKNILFPYFAKYYYYIFFFFIGSFVPSLFVILISIFYSFYSY